MFIFTHLVWTSLSCLFSLSWAFQKAFVFSRNPTVVPASRKASITFFLTHGGFNKTPPWDYLLAWSQLPWQQWPLEYNMYPWRNTSALGSDRLTLQKCRVYRRDSISCPVIWWMIINYKIRTTLLTNQKKWKFRKCFVSTAQLSWGGRSWTVKSPDIETWNEVFGVLSNFLNVETCEMC